MKITDAHVHYSPQAGPEFLTAFLDRTGTDCAVIQAVSHSRCISLVPGALLMKDRNPDRFYVFGSPDLSGYYSAWRGLGQQLSQAREGEGTRTESRGPGGPRPEARTRASL